MLQRCRRHPQDKRYVFAVQMMEYTLNLFNRAYKTHVSSTRSVRSEKGGHLGDWELGDVGCAVCIVEPWPGVGHEANLLGTVDAVPALFTQNLNEEYHVDIDLRRLEHGPTRDDPQAQSLQHYLEPSAYRQDSRRQARLPPPQEAWNCAQVRRLWHRSSWCTYHTIKYSCRCGNNLMIYFGVFASSRSLPSVRVSTLVFRSVSRP